MNRLAIRLLSHPRLIMVGAVLANLIHPLIHGTPLDSGALDSCILAANAAALCTGDH